MKKQIILCACLSVVICTFAAPQTRKVAHVPTRLDSIRLINPLASTRNHIAVVNVAKAIPDEAWSLAVTYAASRLQLNVWTNTLEKTVFPEVLTDGKLISQKLGEKAKVTVFIEDTETPTPYLTAPGQWCRVNIRPLKADNPDKQTLLDRYAKTILKGFVYACGSGAALDGRSSSNYNTFDLKGIDKTGITVSPDSYFPMLEVLRIVGGEDILTPAIEE